MIAQRPEVVSGFTNAILRAVRYINENPSMAAEEYVGFMPQHDSVAKIEGIMRAYSNLIYAEGVNQPLGTFDPERIAEVQAFYLEHGIISDATPVSDLYTNDFIK